MVDGPWSSSDLIARIVAIESGLTALRQVLDERDDRYKQRAVSQDAAVGLAIANSEKAISKAEAATEKRFDSVNEFRQTLADQAGTFVPKSEIQLANQALAARIDANEARIVDIQQELSGIRAHGGGIKDAWAYLVAIAGLVIAAIAVYVRR